VVKKPEPTKPISWNVYRIASNAVWLDEVQAPDEATAMEKAAAAIQGPAANLTRMRVEFLKLRGMCA
jgi:hypothetical protein